MLFLAVMLLVGVEALRLEFDTRSAQVPDAALFKWLARAILFAVAVAAIVHGITEFGGAFSEGEPEPW